VKVFKPRGSDPNEFTHLRRQVENEYRTTLRLHEACTFQPGLSALRPLAIFPEQLAIVTAEVPGRTFDRVVRSALWGLSPASTAIDAARRVGAWLRTYQAGPPHGKVMAGRAYLDVRLQALVGTALTPQDREFALRAYDALEQSAGDAAAPNVPVHGDLCPPNIVVQPNGDVTVLDLSTATTGTRYQDAAHLFLHLEFQASRMPLRRRFVGSVQAALLTELNPDASHIHPAFKLMLLQHCACHIAQRAQSGTIRAQTLRRKWRRYIRLWAPDRARELTLA
jgi:hypothetical protein